VRYTVYHELKALVSEPYDEDYYHEGEEGDLNKFTNEFMFKTKRRDNLNDLVVEPNETVRPGGHLIVPIELSGNARNLFVETEVRTVSNREQSLFFRITHVLVTDNAGRRWLMRPTSGKFPKRARRYKFYASLVVRSQETHPWHSNASLRFAKVLSVIRGALGAISVILLLVLGPVVLIFEVAGWIVTSLVGLFAWTALRIKSLFEKKQGKS
jgi:hypothetical protein